MSIANCPMCESSLPDNQVQMPKSCPDCGADLSRWIRKSQPPPIPLDPDAPDQETTRPARNGLYCVAAFWAIPSTLILTAMAVGAPRDSFNVTFATIAIALCVMSVIAALDVGAGRRSGRLWAFLPIWILMLNFPLGTIVAYRARERLCDANLN